MLSEAIAKEIIRILTRNGKYKQAGIDPLTPEEIAANHQRRGAMIDQIHKETQEFDKRSGQKPAKAKVKKIA